ncbi:hypothetical protein Btru_008372 [Bulinus truncatus]|nr:hypothetical protein Btru_008372 [Bulinus truncatus]
MGVYLVIIAVVDVVYADVYVVYNESWRKSFLCNFSGFLSILSSETSTILIGLITLDRFISISYPFSARDTSTRLKWKGFISTWVIGFVLALVPAVVPEWKIYSSNVLCLALPLSTEGFEKPPGWELSMAVYVILNFILFICIALGQVGIFVNVMKTRNLSSMRHCSERRTQDMNMAKKLAFVAVSDFLCWFPIGIMGILSLIGQEFDKETYTWMAVFALPVNSALNPMIYTIPVIINRLKRRVHKINITVDELYTSCTQAVLKYNVGTSDAASVYFPEQFPFAIDCRREVREQIYFIKQIVDYLRYNRNWTSLNVSYMTHEAKEPTSLEVLTANITEKKFQKSYYHVEYRDQVSHKVGVAYCKEQFNSYLISIETFAEVNVNFFKGLTVKIRIQSSDFKLCCPKILGANIPTKKCRAPKDAISSCKNIVRDRLKKILVWVVGLMTIAGNSIVLFYRVVWSRENLFHTAYGLFVTGLAVSDLLMGVYLMIIAVVDVAYADVYVVYDESFSGFLSTLSSETSTFLIGLITLDRFLSISYPFSAHDTSTSLKWKGFISIWVIGFVLALVPAVVPKWQIYSSNGLCLALPLRTAGSIKFPGWEFSVAKFYYIYICISSSSIYVKVIMNGDLPSMRHCSERRTHDMNIAKKLAFVAVSDFLCWFPIGIMGILSLIGQEFDKETYAWMAMFVLPVISAFNPMI